MVIAQSVNHYVAHVCLRMCAHSFLRSHFRSLSTPSIIPLLSSKHDFCLPVIMEAAAPIVTESKNTTTEITQVVDIVQEDVQSRVSKPLVCYDIDIKHQGATD